jgi:hypothetical protein
VYYDVVQKARRIKKSDGEKKEAITFPVTGKSEGEQRIQHQDRKAQGLNKRGRGRQSGSGSKRTCLASMKP